MTLVWEYYKLVQGTYCIIDNIDQAQNSYDQEKPRSKNIQNTRKRAWLCLRHPFGIQSHLQLFKCP